MTTDDLNRNMVNSHNIDGVRCENTDVSAVATLTDDDRERAVRESLQRRLVVDLAPAALRVVMKALKGSKTVTKLQFEAAKDTLSRAGFVPPKAAEALGMQDKALAEQSAGQLRRFITQAQGELATRARPVIEGRAVTPKVAPEGGAKLADILDC